MKKHNSQKGEHKLKLKLSESATNKLLAYQ